MCRGEVLVVELVGNSNNRLLLFLAAPGGGQGGETRQLRQLTHSWLAYSNGTLQTHNIDDFVHDYDYNNGNINNFVIVYTNINRGLKTTAQF